MPRYTQAVEDYLKTIYEVQQESGGNQAGTAELAEKLGVSRASVTGMLKKLAASPDRLIDYARYRGVRLTPAGERAALEVVRHHRLLETYLTSALGFAWDEVHAEADHLEHVISEDLEERIAAYLGHPTADPHGAPIPQRDGSLPVRREVRLSDVEAGTEAVVLRVSDRDPELLRYLDRLGLRPPARLRVLERGPFDGPLQVETLPSGAVVPLSRRVTDEVYVVPESLLEGA
jgi:DtxR family Mn-dependent transcriptional regulator